MYSIKKIICILLLGMSASRSVAQQIAFCPTGAEWHYLIAWSGFNPLPSSTFNETIKYEGDSIDGSDILRILSHKRFFLQCSPLVTRTLIKQKGDTVLFKNDRTSNSWQILYNFAALPNQNWITTVLLGNNTTTTYTFTVDSVKQITINGFNLKELYVQEQENFGSNTATMNLVITERLGSSGFLFNYNNYNRGFCDAANFSQALCYQ